MPIISMLINVISGFMADSFRAHKVVFYSGMTVMIVAIVGMYLSPSVNSGLTNSVPHEDICSISYVNMSYEFRLEKLLNNSANVSCQLMCDATQRQKHEIISCWNRAKETNCVKVNVTVAEYLETDMCILKWSSPCVGSCIDLNSTATVGGGTSGLSNVLLHAEFWLLFLFVNVFFSGNVSSVNMADAAALQILGEKHHLFGRVRLFGSIGFGVSGLLTGIIVNLVSRGLDYKIFLPAYIIAVSLNIINMLVSWKIDFSTHTESSTEQNRNDISRILRSPTVILFLATSIILGIGMGCVWTFLMLLAADVATDWNPEFQNIQLLQGMIIGTETFLSELPWFFFADRIIKKIGNMLTNIIVLISIVARFFSYFLIENPWLFIPAELFHGACFALLYANAGSFAGLTAPKGVLATLQGIIRGTVMAGVSVGGLVGGFLYSAYGGKMMFAIMGLSTALYTIIYIFSLAIIRLCCQGKIRSYEVVRKTDPEEVDMDFGQMKPSFITESL